jgi:hypothetical protein
MQKYANRPDSPAIADEPRRLASKASSAPDPCEPHLSNSRVREWAWRFAAKLRRDERWVKQFLHPKMPPIDP